MDTGLALVLGSAVWGTAACFIAVHMAGKRSDTKQLVQLYADVEQLKAAVLQSGSVLTNIVHRMNKLEAPIARKQVF